MCDFLNVERTEFTGFALQDSGFPRDIENADIEMKISAFRNAVRPKIYRRLMELQSNYNRLRYGLY